MCKTSSAEEGELIERLIREEKAIIYVCGSSGKMPKAVREALIDACVEHNPSGRSRKRFETNSRGLRRKADIFRRRGRSLHMHGEVGSGQQLNLRKGIIMDCL